MGETKIEWAKKVWNPVTGCTPVSEGCANCYAERMSKRLAGRAGYPKDNPFAVTLHPDRLDQPLRWRKPRRIFVCSMGDLFHKDINAEILKPIYETIAKCPQHTFIVLTKRPKRAALFLNGLVKTGDHINWGPDPYPQVKWVPRNVWLGVSVENQARADERIPILLDIPAAVRFVSIEPMLGPVDVSRYFAVADSDGHCTRCGEFYGEGILTDHECPGGFGRPLDWVIVGGESGPGARALPVEWVRSVREQCITAGVPFFFKGWGEYGLNTDWPLAYPGTPSYRPTHKRVGKKAAGRELDGRTWGEYPVD